MPSLADIAATSGLSSRAIRYVLDQGLLPGGAVQSRGRGAVRVFTPFEAFGIVLATVLKGAGLTRRLVRATLAATCAVPGRGRRVASPLERAFVDRVAGTFDVGDFACVRIAGSGWLPLPGRPAPPVSWTPLVILSVDVAAVRRMAGGTGMY